MKKLTILLLMMCLGLYMSAQTYQTPSVQGNKQYSGYQKYTKRVTITRGLLVGEVGQRVIDSITVKNNKVRFKYGSALVDPLISDSISALVIPVISLVFQANGDTTGVSASKPGDLFIDKTNGKLYFSKAAGRGKWIIAN